jgi:hypothetical protein
MTLTWYRQSLVLYVCCVDRCLSCWCMRSTPKDYICFELLHDSSIWVRSVWRYQRSNHNPYIEEEQTTQWPKEKVQKDKQRSTQHTYKTKDCLYQVRVITVFTVFRLLTDFVCLYNYEFWLSPLCCLLFFDIRIMITPLVSSNTSYSNAAIM